MKNNVLIAEFMGRKGKVRPSLYWVNIPEIKWVTVEEMKFHSDWNWLIPVIKRISTIVSTELNAEEFAIKEGYSERLNPYDYDMQSLYKGCVEFIKWYNSTR